MSVGLTGGTMLRVSMRTLRGLLELRYQPFEIVLVDNAPSSDMTKDAVLAEFGDDRESATYASRGRERLSLKIAVSPRRAQTSLRLPTTT